MGHGHEECACEGAVLLIMRNKEEEGECDTDKICNSDEHEFMSGPDMEMIRRYREA